MNQTNLKRRELLTGAAAGAAAVALSSDQRTHAAEDDFLDIIDGHTHFYDPSRAEGVPWPQKGTPLYRTVLPKHLHELPKYRPVTGTVVVEASAWVEDNAWILDLAKDDPFIVGFVGRLTPGEEEFGKHLKRFAANELFRGIRVNYRLFAKLLESNNLKDFQMLADLDLQLDVNGGTQTPSVAARLAGRLPELRIVINHVGNVGIDNNPPPQDWAEGMRVAADHENVFCKISALVEGASRGGREAPTDLDFYRPYIDVVWNAFGNDRVIYGSNWPVSDRGASYAVLQKIALDYASERGKEALPKFCSLNAKRAYKWVERNGRLNAG